MKEHSLKTDSTFSVKHCSRNEGTLSMGVNKTRLKMTSYFILA